MPRRRLMESGDVRLTENGGFRLLELQPADYSIEMTALQGSQAMMSRAISKIMLGVSVSDASILKNMVLARTTISVVSTSVVTLVGDFVIGFAAKVRQFVKPAADRTFIK